MGILWLINSRDFRDQFQKKASDSRPRKKGFRENYLREINYSAV